MAGTIGAVSGRSNTRFGVRTRRLSAWIYAGSLALFVVGVLFAFVLPSFLG